MGKNFGFWILDWAPIGLFNLNEILFNRGGRGEGARGAEIAAQFYLPLIPSYNWRLNGEHGYVPLGLKGFEKDLKGCWRIYWLARRGSPDGEAD